MMRFRYLTNNGNAKFSRGAIYLRLFNNHLESTLSTIDKENKLIYLMGDTNIDLLKNGEHSLTSDFLDMMYSHNLIPLITKPTRVTQTTATLIEEPIEFSSPAGSRVNPALSGREVYRLS